MTEQEIDDLFAATLLGDYDDEEPWKAVAKLRLNGNRRIFDVASKWCIASEPQKRARGASILGQLRAPHSIGQKQSKRPGDPIFVEESYEIISRMLENESDAEALGSEIFALGHLYREAAVPLILNYVDHPDENIRFAATCSLGHFPQNETAIQALVRLADDYDDDVRNYALFALGTQSNLDTPELRETLAMHLNDPFTDAREEAIAGLAKRKDERAVLPLLRLMEAGSYPMHLEDCFEKLVGEERSGEEKWGTEDFIDALYARFSDRLPPR